MHLRQLKGSGMKNLLDMDVEIQMELKIPAHQGSVRQFLSIKLYITWKRSINIIIMVVET